MRAVIFLAFLGPALAAPRSNTRIVGGNLTTIQEFPYMVNMQYSWSGAGLWLQTCGGSLLTNTAVLSAAHCYERDEDWQWRVVLGSTLAHSGGTVHTVNRIVLHPQYNSPLYDNDIAIVHVTNPVVYTSSIQPARIPGPNYSLQDDQVVTALGWGRQWVQGPYSETLRRVEVDVINQQECAERYAYLKSQPGYDNIIGDVSDGMVCTGVLDVGGRDSCQGDSGGPVAHFGDIVVGITSWGWTCADPVYPGVNTRVSFYSNWIVNNV